jgi:hypothetical protein
MTMGAFPHATYCFAFSHMTRLARGPNRVHTRRMTTHTLDSTRNVEPVAAPECAEFCRVDHAAGQRDEWVQGGGRECLSFEAVDHVDGLSVQASRWVGPDGAAEPIAIVLTTPNTVHALTLREATTLQLAIADAVRICDHAG